jgi:hypothetical protein
MLCMLLLGLGTSETGVFLGDVRDLVNDSSSPFLGLVVDFLS